MEKKSDEDSSIISIDIPEDMNSKISFEKPIHPKIGKQLISLIEKELSSKKKKYPNLKIGSIENRESFIIGIDFGVILSEEEKKKIAVKIPQFLDLIIKKLYGNAASDGKGKHQPTSFTEILGTFRIRVSLIFLPILICIFSAMFLGWLAYVKGGINIDFSRYTIQDNPTWDDVPKIIVNGIIPVVGSAIFVTILWILIKRFGLIVMKIIMGILVMFYVWYGFSFFAQIPYMIYAKQIEILPRTIENVIYLSYWIMFFGSAIFFLILGIRFFRNKLSLKTRNLLVLTYGIFMGAILGISFGKWTIISFGIFLSIWDIITVFFGPLGKIADKLKENQVSAHNNLKDGVANGEISEEEANKLSQFVELQEFDLKKTSFWKIANNIEIELGSGDLILYSALVANVFIISLSWILTLVVICGIMIGVFATLYILVKKKKMLPALPISMFIGITIYLIGLFVFL